MRVYDVLGGGETALPSSDVTPGRYRVLTDCLLNGRIPLAAGDLLWRCGPGLVRITDSRCPDAPIEVHFARELALEQPDELIESALDAVIQAAQEASFDELPSPLLPPELRQLSELLPFEEILEKALEAGHLQEIAARPRLDMHYVREALPVARAKRVSAAAVEHLAQHSENWSRRVIGGVVPARVLALVSEDDYAIYENVVFARLVDACWRWLSRRVLILRALESGHQGAQSLAHAEDLHRLLRERLCTLWGSAWSTESSESKRTSETRDRLEKMLAQVTRLRQSKVYSSVQRTAHVPAHLRSTNILQFDKRYRTLRPLWDGVHRLKSRADIDELSSYRRQQTRYEQFEAYASLMVRRALRDMGCHPTGSSADNTYVLGPWRLCLSQPGRGELEVLIHAAGKADARVQFALSWSMDTTMWEERAGRGDRHLLYASLPKDREALPIEHWVVNPFRFYGVEWIRSRLERKLLSLILSAYPLSVNRLPEGLINRLGALAPEGFKRFGRGVVVLPIGDERAEQLGLILRDAKELAPVVADELTFAIQACLWLARCRACGTVSKRADVDADERGFRLRCPACRLTIRARTDPARTLSSGYENGSTDFVHAGAIALSI